MFKTLPRLAAFVIFLLGCVLILGFVTGCSGSTKSLDQKWQDHKVEICAKWNSASAVFSAETAESMIRTAGKAQGVSDDEINFVMAKVKTDC